MSEVKEALEAAFDFLGGVDGASEIRDKLLRAMTAPVSPPAEALPSPTSGAEAGVDAVVRRATYLLNRGVNDLGAGEIDSFLRLAASSGPTAIKPLEWLDSGTDSKCDSPVGAYRIIELSDRRWLIELNGAGVRNGARSMDDAKAAAQADYENRIRSAFSSTALAKPASEPAGGGEVWFGFDENTGEFTGEYSTVKPHDTRGMIPFVRALSSPASSSPVEAEALPVWVDAVAVRSLIERYDAAMACQKESPDASLIVMANYGDLAINHLRRLVSSAPAQEDGSKDLSAHPRVSGQNAG